MLKDRVTDLINRYETGDDGWLSELDVREELEEILDEEEYDNELTPKLEDAISNYVLAQHEYKRYAGHVSDGGEDFITQVKEIIGYIDEVDE